MNLAPGLSSSSSRKCGSEVIGVGNEIRSHMGFLQIFSIYSNPVYL